MIDLPPEETGQEFCFSCRKLKDRSEFAPSELAMSVNGRGARCSQCKVERDATQRRAVSLAKTQIMYQMLHRAANRKEISFPHVSELCGALVRRFGGVDAVAEQWYQQIQKAIEKSPGSRNVLDAFMGLAKLATWSTENQDTAPMDMADLSDEDLARELAAVTQKLNLPAPEESLDQVPAE